MEVLLSNWSSRYHDLLLRQSLEALAPRGIAPLWVKSDTPHSDLRRECTAIAADPARRSELVRYLERHPVLAPSVANAIDTVWIGANASSVRESLDKGPFVPGTVARWLPTFLVIDGPLGRFLTSSDSPLCKLLRGKENSSLYPTLAQARDTFNHDVFRRVRNGVGHWSFVLEPEDEGRLVCFDAVSGDVTVSISRREAEALHMVSLMVTECVGWRLIRGLQS